MTDRDKWSYLERAALQDARHPGIVRLAALCLELAAGNTQRALVMAHAVAGRGIRYQLDTARVGAEDIAGFTRPAAAGDPVDAWRRGVDDCDAKARLFVALATALGVRARLAPLWSGELLSHVYAEVDLGGAWVPVELTLARAMIGEFPRAVPKEADGKWLET
jgi:transglutaminase-like putative cysteine protease